MFDNAQPNELCQTNYPDCQNMVFGQSGQFV